MSRNTHHKHKTYVLCPEPYVMIPHSLILSPEFNNLMPISRLVYYALLTKWNRDKTKYKDEFVFTYSDMVTILRIGRGTLAHAIKELDEKEYIYRTPGGKNNPTTYKLNYTILIR